MDSEYDIAIVGMSCRMPGARNIDEFWRNLAGGIESITRLSDEEIVQSGVPRAHVSASNYVKAAPLLEEPGGFDAPFFGFSPMEARMIDPQHRILLELAWEALEDAGCDSGRYRGRIGVFTGAAMNTYFMNSGLSSRFSDDYIPTLIASDKDFLSTRLSYKLNLKGPSITIQTACSTSLVAVHLARQSLLTEETDMALAGAVSVRVPHRAGYFFDAGGVVSPDGHVRAFDARANGTVFGSGGGIIALKRLKDAIADGNTIHAVIKGSAVNNDGSEKAGYTTPSVNSQADAVVEAVANAGIDGNSISYIEAHGSGTPVGDPIEIMALTKAFRTFTEQSGYCAIGSVKTNVGHLDAASGIAGLIKTVLALKHRQIPASLNYSQANPEIDFPGTPFYVNTVLAPWTSEGPRRAGIMSTGMGGTNAHVVLEEAPPAVETVNSNTSNLLILSARTPTALDSLSARVVEFLKSSAAINMDDVAFTLQTGRRRFPYRKYLVGAGRVDAIARLEETSKRIGTSHIDESPPRPVMFLLPGVGSHYVGMAHGLYEHFAAFRSEVDRCAQILEPYLGADIRQIIYPRSAGWRKHESGRRIDLKKMLAGTAAGQEDADTKTLNQTAYTQPALFSIEYALARLWNHLGIVPDAIVGHSMGEYVAACLSGVLSLEDALRLIVRRTQLVDQLPRGRMLAVALPESEVLSLLHHDLSIALINGPNLCVVAGPVPAVDDFERTLKRKEVIYRPVDNTHAFHSRMLDPIVKPLEEEVRKVRLNAPKIPFMSNVTGTWISKIAATDPAYWAGHANHTARFSDALRTLWQSRNAILLETGPGKTIGVLALQHPARMDAGNPTAISSLRHHYENQPDVEFLMHSAGELWLSGIETNWDNLHQGKSRRTISLPTYPFERQNYWLQQDESPAIQELPPNGQETEQSGIDNWFYVPSWERTPFPGMTEDTSNRNGTFWLIFTDRRGEGTVFRNRLEEAGAAVQVVRFGERFHRRSDVTFEINPNGLQDYMALFREIKGRLPKSVNIIHLGCLTPDDDKKVRIRDDNQNYGFFSLLYIAQAIGELNISVPIKVGIISNRLHEVTGEERLDPEMATVLGPSGVIPKEFPNVTCFNIDLPVSSTVDRLRNDTIDSILSEFVEPKRSDVIAYRGTHRWRRKYEQVKLPALGFIAGNDAPVPKRLRSGGVYLITGGTGGIGLAIAKYLAKSCRARLVLTRRTAFPEKSKWAEQLRANGTAQSTVETIRDLIEIENMGSEVEVHVAEASNHIQMRGVIDQALKKYKSINGVIHAAGIVSAGLIQAKTKDMADSVLSPKVRGTWVLHDLLADVDLDFLVLFSSVTSVIAPYAESDYAGANSFLDSFAWFCNAQRRFHTLTINWPGWKETGQLAKLESKPGMEEWKDEALKKAIRTRDGVESFGRALNSDFCQVIVSPDNLDSLIRQSSEPFDPSWDFHAPKNSAVATMRGEGIGIVDQPRNEIETVVAGIWTDVLGLQQVGIHERFSSLGGHSLLAMQIVSKVRSCYEIGFTLRDFFEAPTIAQLSAAIRQEILKKLESLSDSEAEQMISNEQNSLTMEEVPGLSAAKQALLERRLKGGSKGQASRRIISKRPADAPALLSFAQRQMWVIDQLSGGSPAYNLPVGYRIKGKLHVDALEESFNAIVQRHEVLRTTFAEKDGEPIQVIHPECRIRIATIRLDQLSSNERAARLKELASQESIKAFDLTSLPLIRVSLFRLEESEHILIVNLHHIVADGLSIGLMFRELDIFYGAIASGSSPHPPNLDVQYSDFAFWQRESYSDTIYADSLEFWRNQLSGKLPVLDLRCDKPRPAFQSFEGSNVFFVIPKSLTQKLMALGSAEGCTFFATVLAAFEVILHRYSGAEDILIGTPVANRSPNEIEPLIGNFLNIAVLRGNVSGNRPFIEQLRLSRETTINALSKELPFEKVVERLRFKRDPSRNPIFQTLLQVLPATVSKVGDLDVSSFDFDWKFAHFDLSLHLYEKADGFLGRWEYCTDLFHAGTIEGLSLDFMELLESVARNPQQTIADIPLDRRV